jgi:predicted transcriptional regulator
MGKNKIAQTPIRIPPDLKEKLLEIAEREHWTMNQAMLEAIKILIANKLN